MPLADCEAAIALSNLRLVASLDSGITSRTIPVYLAQDFARSDEAEHLVSCLGGPLGNLLWQNASGNRIANFAGYVRQRVDTFRASAPTPSPGVLPTFEGDDDARAQAFIEHYNETNKRQFRVILEFGAEGTAWQCTEEDLVLGGASKRGEPKADIVEAIQSVLTRIAYSIGDVRCKRVGN